MKVNVLRQVEVENVVFYSEHQYSREHRNNFIEVFNELVTDGKLTGSFEDNKWFGFSGVKKFGIDLNFDKLEYQLHFGKLFGISYKTMQDMLRCYAVYIMGSYIFPTINDRVSVAKQLITTVGNRNLSFPVEASDALYEFLYFINTPENEVDDLMRRIRFCQARKAKPRELSHLINYLAIANEINELFKSSPPDAEFRKWFPIFFWSNVTFIIPLRATEMLVTPYDCITRKDGRIYIKLRRTQLKGNHQSVYYNVEQDYKEFTYEIPDSWIVETIERYQELTACHPRKYLFDHSKYMINGMVSLQSFNMLLAEFVETFLIGNHKYDYARYATGINEFDLVTAGDSRPIAMANLYFQDISADICRQLADHSQISTSFGYYTNVSNTIYCSSIMKIQQRINREKHTLDTEYDLEKYGKTRSENDAFCASPRQPWITGDINDCVKENHLHECLGCRYYSPSSQELKAELEKRKKKLDEISKQLVEFIADTRTGGGTKTDLDKLFLETQTGAIRFKVASDEYAEEVEYKWRRHRSSQKKNC